MHRKDTQAFCISTASFHPSRHLCATAEGKYSNYHFCESKNGKTSSLTLGVNILGMCPARLYYTVDRHCAKGGALIALQLHGGN